jgi:hypothetical protein
LYGESFKWHYLCEGRNTVDKRFAYFSVYQTVVRRSFRKKKHCKHCIKHLKNEKYTHTCLCFLFDFKQEVG